MNNMKRMIYVMAVFLAVFSLSCDREDPMEKMSAKCETCGSGPGMGMGGGSFYVMSATPANGNLSVSTGTSVVTIVFSQPVDSATINQSILTPLTNLPMYNVTVSSATVTITLTTLASLTVYNLSIPITVKSIAGCAKKGMGKMEMINAFMEKGPHCIFNHELKENSQNFKNKNGKNWIAHLDDIVDSYWVLETLKVKENLTNT